MNQEDAYQVYNCVRKEFPSYVNFEGCPWVETIDRTWVRSNAGYLMEVTPTMVKVTGPVFEGEWPVYQWTKEQMRKDILASSSETSIG
jgi:hypothetical protein